MAQWRFRTLWIHLNKNWTLAKEVVQLHCSIIRGHCFPKLHMNVIRVTVSVTTTTSLLGGRWMQKSIVLKSERWPKMLLSNRTDLRVARYRGDRSAIFLLILKQPMGNNLSSCLKGSQKTPSSQKDDVDFWALRIEDYNVFKARPACAERLNSYLESSGTLCKEAYVELRVELNNALVRNEGILSPPSSTETSSTSASRGFAPRVRMPQSKQESTDRSWKKRFLT